MHISHVTIRNFRALEEIDCELSPHVNVIVGPNAVGKTTILQAIRLTKALLAPRTQNESQQVLISLGAASPHFPQRLFPKGLARDPTQSVEIRSTYNLQEEEVTLLNSNQPQLVQTIVAARAGLSYSNVATLIQYLQSFQGTAATQNITNEVSAALTRIGHSRTLTLGLSIDCQSGLIAARDPLAGSIVGFLDQRLPVSTTIFSYFPADRALPIGEVNLQLGGPDLQQQLESHNSQPQLKYLRLKSLIINSLVIDGSSRDVLTDEFEKIFSGLLKGRRIKRININDVGLLSIETEEIRTGTIIELDSLSSGEKNVALTFLILALSVFPGGIALFDEPELHLNPAVSRELLDFVVEKYSKPRKIQFVMCSHSPEILSGAFANEDCVLLHLKGPSDISRIGRRAMDEYADALRRLGTSVSESLLYDGTVFVEGDDDVTFLETSFPDLLKKYRVKELGGRREVEKTIAEIQELERRGDKVAPIFFIFDRDQEPSRLQTSGAVRVHQWQVTCLENYMLDLDVITELLKDDSITKNPFESEGDVRKLMKELAFKQIDAIAARETFKRFDYPNTSPLKADFQKESLSEIGTALYQRLASAKHSLSSVTEERWKADFLEAAEKTRSQLSDSWESSWKELCDGKKLLSDLHKEANLKLSLNALKNRIAQRMRDTKSDNWKAVKSVLESLIGGPAVA